MKLCWSLWLLDLVHAAKVRPGVVTAPLDLLVQEPGLEASNHTLFNTLGDKESALALMNATENHSFFIDGGDEVEQDLDDASDHMADMEEGMDQGIMEHDMEHDMEHGMDAMDDFHEEMDQVDEHYDEHYDDHDSDDDMHFDPEENSLALASEKGMSYLNSSMNSTSAMGWRWGYRHGCKSCRRWNRNICTSCHRGWRKYGRHCHARHCGHPCKSCPGFWHRQQNNHCNACHGGWALVGRTCKREHDVSSGWSARGDDRWTYVDCPHGMWVKKCWASGGGNYDGTWVSHNGKRCHAQSGHGRERVRAHAKCWTTPTTSEHSGHHWRGGNVNVKCHHGDAIGCTCYTAWKVRHQCRDPRNHGRRDATFNPTNGMCQRNAAWRIKVFAICSQAKCGHHFKCPHGYKRKHHNTVGSSAAKCCQKDYKCGHPCKGCPAMDHRHQHNHCNSCHGGWALVGRTCKTEHTVHSGWSHHGDDKLAWVDCPHGMWVKSCWVSGAHWHDGAFVSHDGRRCHAQSGHPRERVKANAHCWTTKTIAQDSGRHWRGGHVNVGCSSGDAISCTCNSAWKMRKQCSDPRHRHHRASTFDPTNGKCRRYGNWRVKVFALCSQKPCGNFNCPAGYVRKHHDTIGSSAAKCCTPVSCPANSHGDNVPSGCKCNAGYHGSITANSGGYTGGCHAAGCPWWTSGSSVVDGCKCWKGYFGHISAKEGDPWFKGTCKSALVGGTFAFHNRIHNRFWKMTGSDMVRSPRKGAAHLPDGWSAERFKVYEGGHARVGFYGTWAHKWVMMHHGDMAVQKWMRGWEKFRVWDAGDGVAMHNDHHKRFICLRNHKTMVGACDRTTAPEIPAGCTWERFTIVQAVPAMKVGLLVALTTHHRFLQMTHNWHIVSHHARINQMEDSWTSTFFEVKDAGNGQVALWNSALSCYVMLNAADIYRTQHLTDESKFTVVDMGHGRVGLHNARHNRFVGLHSGGNAYPTGHRDGDQLPGDWWDQIFYVVKVFTCHTGGGSHCRSCPGPGHRKFNNQCDSCNAGYYLKDSKCHVVNCPAWTEGSTVPDGCTCWKGYFGTIKPSTSDPYYTGSCKSELVGGTVAFHSATQNRFLKMVHNDLTRSPKRNVDQLPDAWGAERFKIVEGGAGRVGIKGTSANQYAMMNHADARSIGHMKDWEKFRIRDEGANEVGIHNENHNRFLRMSSSTTDTSGHKGMKDLPSGWTWERFKVVQAVPALKVGKIVTLNVHDRFLWMHTHWHMVSHPGKVDDYPDDWIGCRYKVVDGGNGQVALYNEHSKMYLRLTSSDIYRNANLNDESRFTVVDMGGNKVALHNAKTNRFLALHGGGNVYVTDELDGDRLPATWVDAIFTVTQFFSCKTGGGASCRSCPGASKRSAHNQCDSCNAGYYLKDNKCHAAACPEWAEGSDVPSGCKCWTGYLGTLKPSRSSPYYTGTCKSALVGGTVAFHNSVQNRFMKMVKNDLTRSPRKNADKLPDGWSAERFKVLEGGDARVGIKGTAVDQYAMMNHADARSIGHMRSWEKFRIKDAGSGKVALHNSNHQRFMRMSDSTFDTSGKKGMNQLPGGWTWERFQVVQVHPMASPCLQSTVMLPFVQPLELA